MKESENNGRKRDREVVLFQAHNPTQNQLPNDAENDKESVSPICQCHCENARGGDW